MLELELANPWVVRVCQPQQGGTGCGRHHDAVHALSACAARIYTFHDIKL